MTNSKAVSLDLILVVTTSPLPDIETEKILLNGLVITGLKETQLFTAVNGGEPGVHPGDGIKVGIAVKAINKVSSNARLWFGGLAGQAWVQAQVMVSDLSSGRLIEAFTAEGKSGGSAKAGTTDEAVQRAAEQVVAEVVRLNAQTAQ